MATWIALAIVGIAILAIFNAKDSKLLMPGPVATVHGSSSTCATCHTNVGKGQFGWLHALVKYANPKKESGACLVCHKMGAEGTSPHTLPSRRLKIISKKRYPDGTKGQRSMASLVQDVMFPVGEPHKKQVFCATCHKEHRGGDADLSAMPDNRCQTCHQVQFKNFQKDHPEFVGYPFRRRTRIAFDHAAHFNKRFPETREKRPNFKNIPNTCTDCHTSAPDKRHMSVKPFSATCSGCHLPQIVGSERATGPKGLALIALPGLDVETLKEKGIDIGEWPENSEAEISPLMKLLMAGDNERRNLLRIVDSLDLLDLSEASAEHVAAVGTFAWEVKQLIYALATTKASEVMQAIGAATGESLDHELMAKLIATMPRDVLASAKRDWLPNLAEELATKRNLGLAKAGSGNSRIAGKAVAASAKRAKLQLESAARQARLSKLATNPKLGRWQVDAFGDLFQEGDQSSSSGRDNDENASDNAAEKAKLAVDAEAWAEFGGWYRKDFAILYKPTGHADPFIRAWLDFSANAVGKYESGLAASVFDLLTFKEAQGQCTKCHSIDAAESGARAVQWNPSSFAGKKERFTTFTHEPHFGLLDDRGCLTCHALDEPKKFKQSYKQFDPSQLVSNFKPVDKKLCATCHKKGAARQDCLLCHNYHVTPVRTPILSTRIPSKRSKNIKVK